jgi:hypothetical protein
VDGSILQDPLPGGDGPPPPPPPPPPPGRYRRFEGSASLGDPKRPLPELSKLVDEVINRLAQDLEVHLEVSLQIEAKHAGADGFTEDQIRTVTENAKTLKMRDIHWEKE